MTNENYNSTLKSLTKNKGGEIWYDSYKSIEDIITITNCSTILELGFNRGASALMWLETSNSTLHSMDQRGENEVEKSIKYLNKSYPGRFTYTELNHKNLPNLIDDLKNNYDLIYIDGDHSKEGILRDAKNAIKLNPKYIAFDDYFHGAHGLDTKSAIKECGLEVIKEYDTSCGHVLTKNPFKTPTND